MAAAVMAAMWKLKVKEDSAMKALSVRQPWAWLIAKGIKPVENRGRNFLYRGRIYIHSSQRPDNAFGFKRAYQLLAMTTGDCDEVWREFWDWYRGPSKGYLIVTVDLTDCVFRYEEDNDGLYSPWHAVGMYGLILRNPEILKPPIPYKGRLGLFEVKV